MRKTLYTLNVGGKYAPELVGLTYPLLSHYAGKIGAEVLVITERKFPDWPIVYEKMQVGALAAQRDDDWSIFIDSDTLIHPDTIDFSNYIPPDFVAHNGTDFANLRWRYDRYFLRDGRNVGSCNWNTWASRLCYGDLWRPLDISFGEALSNIFPVADERAAVEPAHLIDDYTLSRNIARHGLRVTTLGDVQARLGLDNRAFFWHQYTIPIECKVMEAAWVLKVWNLHPSLCPKLGVYLDRFADEFNARDKARREERHE